MTRYCHKCPNHVDPTNLALVQKWPALSHFHHCRELPVVQGQWRAQGTCTGSPEWCCQPHSWTATSLGRWVWVWEVRTALLQLYGPRSCAAPQPLSLPLHIINKSAISPSECNCKCLHQVVFLTWNEQTIFVALHGKTPLMCGQLVLTHTHFLYTLSSNNAPGYKVWSQKVKSYKSQTKKLVVVVAFFLHMRIMGKVWWPSSYVPISLF